MEAERIKNPAASKKDKILKIWSKECSVRRCASNRNININTLFFNVDSKSRFLYV